MTDDRRINRRQALAGLDAGESRANARLTFEDVQLEPVVVSGDGDDAHLVLAAPEGYADERALYLDIHISCCDGLFAVFEDAAADDVAPAPHGAATPQPPC